MAEVQQDNRCVPGVIRSMLLGLDESASSQASSSVVSQASSSVVSQASLQTYTEGREIGSGTSGTIYEIYPDFDFVGKLTGLVESVNVPDGTALDSANRLGIPDGTTLAVKHFDCAEDETFRDDCLAEVSNLLILRGAPNVLQLLDIVWYDGAWDSPATVEAANLPEDDDDAPPLPGIGIVMPRMDCDLLTAIESGNLSNQQKLKIFVDIMVGVGAIHAAGIIHNDLKTENILVRYGVTANHLAGSDKSAGSLDDNKPATKPPTVTASAVVCDLSFATIATTPKPSYGSGTTGYRSPEAAAGDKPCWFPRDIWSVGVIALELFAEIVPFALNEREAFAWIREKRDKLGHGVIPDTIRALLSEDPGHRPSTAAVVRTTKTFARVADPGALERIDLIRPPGSGCRGDEVIPTRPEPRIPKKIPVAPIKVDYPGRLMKLPGPDVSRSMKSPGPPYPLTEPIRANILYWYSTLDIENPICLTAAQEYYKASGCPAQYCVIIAAKLFEPTLYDTGLIRDSGIPDYNAATAYMYELAIFRAMGFQMFVVV